MLYVLIVAIISCVGEYFLTNFKWGLGLVLPALALFAAVLYNNYFFYLGGILLLVFIVAFLIRKKFGKKSKSMEKMKIQDLK